MFLNESAYEMELFLAHFKSLKATISNFQRHWEKLTTLQSLKAIPKDGMAMVSGNAFKNGISIAQSNTT